MKRYLDDNGFYSFEVECEMRWNELSDQERSDYVKYLRLHFKFGSDPKSLTKDEKAFLFKHIDTDIEIIPAKWHRVYNLKLCQSEDDIPFQSLSLNNLSKVGG